MSTDIVIFPFTVHNFEHLRFGIINQPTEIFAFAIKFANAILIKVILRYLLDIFMTANEPDKFEMLQFPWQLMDFIPLFMILEGIEDDLLLDFPSECTVIPEKLHKFADGHQITPVFLDGFLHVSFVLNPFTLFQSSIDVCFAMFVPKIENRNFPEK